MQRFGKLLQFPKGENGVILEASHPPHPLKQDLERLDNWKIKYRHIQVRETNTNHFCANSTISSFSLGDKIVINISLSQCNTTVQ